MVEIFIPPRNFWPGDEREALGLVQGMRVRAILEFRTIWMLHLQTIISNRIGDWLNTQGGIPFQKKMGIRDMACLNGLQSLPQAPL